MNPRLPVILFYVLVSLLTAQLPPAAGDDAAFASLLISTQGLHYIKDLLISKALSSLIPLCIPQIQQSHNVPLLGNVVVLLSNITIHQINVSESYFTPGDSGINIIVSGATANLSLDWSYCYSYGWFIPSQISDRGTASVKVEGMQAGLTFGLRNEGGALKLSFLECGCFIRDLDIKVEGGIAWLYQWFVEAFVGQIKSAVETTITKKLKEGFLKLDSFLQSFPREIPVDDVASLNVTFISDPVLCNSSIALEINGLFTPRDQSRNAKLDKEHFRTLSCDDPSKMIGISIDEAVFNSASTLYFEAGYLQWILDKIPDQALLNTAGWRFIIPQLYKKYPNDDMNLNVSLASPPLLRVSRQKIDVSINANFIIDVLEGGEVMPVACILLELQASCSVSIRGSNLVGKVKLGDFKMTLQWSKIGKLKMFLVQPVIWTVVETVLLPYVNTRLWVGFPLPMIHGFTLEKAKISNFDSRLIICSDVAYSDLEYLARLPVRVS